jgi:GNAT superfamily N-acetyltransferase
VTNAIEPLGVPSDGDLDVIVELLALLGYEATAEQVARRIARMKADAGHENWVVRNGGGEIVGLAGGQVMWGFNDDAPIAQLIILVVREGSHGLGIGSDLILHFEKWARSQGASRFFATSAAAVDSVSRFYARRGYHAAGLRFFKLG